MKFFGLNVGKKTEPPKIAVERTPDFKALPVIIKEFHLYSPGSEGLLVPNSIMIGKMYKNQSEKPVVGVVAHGERQLVAVGLNSYYFDADDDSRYMFLKNNQSGDEVILSTRGIGAGSHENLVYFFGSPFGYGWADLHQKNYEVHKGGFVGPAQSQERIVSVHGHSIAYGGGPNEGVEKALNGMLGRVVGEIIEVAKEIDAKAFGPMIDYFSGKSRLAE